MCCPDHYGVNYEINPWMKKINAPDIKQAWRQWKNLHHHILRLGGWVEYVHPVAGSPDMVFTANAGLVHGKRCVISHFRYKERQTEEPAFTKWFQDHGYEILELKDCYFEGEGDALFAGETLFAAEGYRSDAASRKYVSDFLGVKKIVSCELINPYFYHLDTCFCPLTPDLAIYYPEAFSEESRKEMSKAIKLVEVPEAEAKRFACNSVILGKDIIIPGGCPLTEDILRKNGYTPHAVELDEFIKAGGAAKCLSLKL